MKNADYYYNLMLEYSRSKRNFEVKKSLYEHIIEKLKEVSSSLKVSKSYFVNTETSLLDGGYVYQGETLGKGILKNNYEKIEQVVNDLNTVISKTQIKIQEFEEKVKHFANLYNEAEKNYNKAKNGGE